MSERTEKLRERVRDVLDQMCPAADPPFAPEEAAHVLRAVVEELGLRKRMAYHEETHAIHTLLEAAEDER